MRDHVHFGVIGAGGIARRKTIPVSAATGRSTSCTLVPLCSPIPTDRATLFRVLCFSMALGL